MLLSTGHGTQTGGGVDNLYFPALHEGREGGGHIIIILRRTPALWNPSVRHSCSPESILNASKCLCLLFLNTFLTVHVVVVR